MLTVTPALCAMSVGLVGTLTVSAPLDHPLVNRVLDRLSPGVGNIRTRRIRTLLLLGVALVCALGGLGLMAIGALRRPDLGSVDMRFDVRGAKPTPDDVVVVGIDDTTLNARGYRFPFNRRHYARVIRQLDKAGAAAIAFDVQFTQPSEDDGADNALITAVRSAAPRVVLAATAVNPGGRTKIFGGGDGLRFSRAIPGYSNFIKDSDGVTRHMLDGDEGVDSFAIAAAQIKLGHEINAPPGNSGVDRFRRPAQHGAASELRGRRARPLQGVRRARQGRRGRWDRLVAPGHP